jgi:hypothetical protein
MKTLNMLLLVTALTGCVRIPVIVQVPRCASDMAMQPCAPPVTIKEGRTYADMLVGYEINEVSLKGCSLDLEYLQKAVNACNRIIDEHNQRAKAEPGHRFK